VDGFEVLKQIRKTSDVAGADAHRARRRGPTGFVGLEIWRGTIYLPKTFSNA